MPIRRTGSRSGPTQSLCGEFPVVYVTLAAGKTAIEAEAIEFAREYIAERPAWPKRVYIVDALPLTELGNVHEPSLRADAAVRLLGRTLAERVQDTSFEIEAKQGGKRGFAVSVTMFGSNGAIVDKVDAELKELLFEYTIQRVTAPVQSAS